MKRKFTLGLMGLTLVLALGACSTSKLAQQDNNDDVYNSVAKAKELPQYEKKQPQHRTDEQLYGGEDYSDNYANEEYEGEYQSRLNRFYYNTPWRTYYDNYNSYRYDPYFDYPFGFNTWYRPGLSLNLGFGSPWMNDNYYWGYYGSPYNSRFWGPYSYYNSYPGYGYGYGGYYGGGYYNRPVYASPNYRSRPNRENTIRNGGSIYNTPSRGTSGTSYGRPERYTPGAGRTSSRAGTQQSGEGRSAQPAATSRPSRPARTEEYRAPRESSSPRQEQSRPSDYSRPTRSSSGSSSSGSSGGSSSGSSGGSSSGSSRPSRGGR